MKKQNRQTLFYSGISGLQLNIPRSKFPPPYQDASRLTYYSTLFNSIEINSSFYRLPKETTVARWVDSVHGNFKFTFKLWKQVTHQKELRFEKADVTSFLRSISPAGQKKGCILIQFPPSLDKVHAAQLAELLQCIRDSDTQDWDIAVEFRNSSWYSENVYRLLENHNAAMVFHDIPKSATPFLDPPGKLVYVRFHGPTGNYRDSYDGSFLAEYAGYMNEWLEDDKTVYAYFNNTMGDAFKNLQALNKLVHKK